MITTITNWKIFESKRKKHKNDGVDIVLCDIQESFKKFFGEQYIDAVNDYCEDYKRVFQIWDSTKSGKPDYIFPNQVMSYQKKYGGKLTIAEVEQTFTIPMWQTVKDKLNAIPNEGDLFENKYGESWVYIGRGKAIDKKIGHEWFLCSKELMSLFKSFIEQERTVILIGGASSECLYDIFIAMNTLGVNVSYNYDLIYSAKGSKFQ